MPLAIAYLAQRLRQSHDIWHVLTGYGVDVPGEAALQAFTYGQLKTPAPALTAFAGAVICLRRGFLRALPAMYRALRRGKRASFLLAVRWEDHWADSLASLRARLGIEVDGAPR